MKKVMYYLICVLSAFLFIAAFALFVNITKLNPQEYKALGYALVFVWIGLYILCVKTLKRKVFTSKGEIEKQKILLNCINKYEREKLFLKGLEKEMLERFFSIYTMTNDKEREKYFDDDTCDLLTTVLRMKEGVYLTPEEHEQMLAKLNDRLKTIYFNVLRK